MKRGAPAEVGVASESGGEGNEWHNLWRERQLGRRTPSDLMAELWRPSESRISLHLRHRSARWCLMTSPTSYRQRRQRGGMDHRRMPCGSLEIRGAAISLDQEACEWSRSNSAMQRDAPSPAGAMLIGAVLPRRATCEGEAPATGDADCFRTTSRWPTSRSTHRASPSVRQRDSPGINAEHAGNADIDITVHAISSYGRRVSRRLAAYRTGNLGHRRTG